MKYALKSNIQPADFSLAINHCCGDVILETKDGDVLNLKSEFCKYIFLAVASSPKDLALSRISCTPEDAALLADYIAIP